jgi:hypothetical protein
MRLLCDKNEDHMKIGSYLPPTISSKNIYFHNKLCKNVQHTVEVPAVTAAAAVVIVVVVVD